MKKLCLLLAVVCATWNTLSASDSASDRVVKGNMVYTYRLYDEGNKVCQLSTKDGVVIIGYDRDYSNIEYVETAGKETYNGFIVEKTIGKKKKYGFCNMDGKELLPPIYKAELQLFVNGAIGYKVKKPIFDYKTDYVKPHVYAHSYYNAAMKSINDKNKALEYLKRSIYHDDYPFNTSLYQIGHYYAFGCFDESRQDYRDDSSSLKSNVYRKHKKPINTSIAMEYLNNSLLLCTADVFADKDAWTYNPQKAIRVYYESLSPKGNLGKDAKIVSEKIGKIFNADMNFDFDTEYYFLQTYKNILGEKDAETVEFLYSVKGLDSIASIVDKIPHGHKSALLNMTDLTNQDLLYMGINKFKSRQFGEALYYFRRGALHNDEQCYTMSVMCLDSIAKRYYPEGANYALALVLSDPESFPYGNNNGKFAKKEKEFRDYYAAILKIMEEEEERKRLERQERARQQQLANEQRANAIIGSLIQGLAQGIQTYYNAKAVSSYNNKRNTSRASSTGSALNIQIPEAFNPARVAAMSKPVYSYDANGNMMVSYPGFAQALGEMNAAIQQTTNAASSQLMATGDPYYIAKAQSLQAMARTNQNTLGFDQQFWSTPMYPVSIDNRSSENEDSHEESDNTVRTNNVAKSKDSYSTTENNTSYSNNTNSRSNDTNRQVERNRNTSRTTVSNSTKDTFAPHKIKTVNLYRRNVDKAVVVFRNIELYRQGASYYVMIGNTKYPLGYSNWSRFNRSITYGHKNYYLDM